MIVLTLAGSGAADLAAAIDRLVDPARLLAARTGHEVAAELRLDLCAEPMQALAAVSSRSLPIVATCRRSSDGGAFSGSETDRIALLRAAGSRVAFVDLEWPEVAAAVVVPARTILSFHGDLGGRSLDRIVDSMCEGEAFARKVAVAVSDLRSLAALLGVAAAYRGRASVFGLGELGHLSRWRALADGDPATTLFYAAAGEAPIGPGQPLLADVVLDAPRLARKGRGATFFALLGNPTQSSYSPRSFNAAFRELGMPHLYATLPTAGLDGLVDVASLLGLEGLSVTAPHKETVIAELDAVAPEAHDIGAVNTVSFAVGGRSFGRNTDYVGVRDPIARCLRSLDRFGAPGRGLVIGAGGAARAAVAGLIALGLRPFVAARRADAATSLAQSFGIGALSLAEAGREPFDVVVHATPAGAPSAPREIAVPHGAVGPRTVAMDMNYRPFLTPWLQAVEGRAAAIVPGIEMFLAQALAQWECFIPGRPEGASVLEKTVRSLIPNDEPRP